jgi:hypothetical protein
MNGWAKPSIYRPGRVIAADRERERPPRHPVEAT